VGDTVSEQTCPIVKSYLLPPMPYFGVFKSNGKIEIDVTENYQKRSYRNKYTVLSANGPLSLSIPLRQGKNKQQNIKDVLIAYDENWVKRHLDTLHSCYGKSAYFDYYFPFLEHTFLKKHVYLFDLNMSMLIQVVQWLKLDVTISESKCYVLMKNLPLQDSRAYPQVFENKYGFVPNLSILDIVLNMGPETRGFL
jgi:hypothetical protein